MNLKDPYLPGTILVTRDYVVGRVITKNNDGNFDLAREKNKQGHMQDKIEAVRAGEKLILLLYDVQRLASKPKEEALVLRVKTNSVLWLREIDFAYHLKAIDL